jgi:CheY-like chemotaxis protein
MFKILFAHPDSKLVQIYTPYLSRHFSVDSAHDGLVALRKIKLLQPHLIVSDCNLPSLSGLALLKFVRSHSVFGTVPFMFLATSGDTHQALTLGANDWLDLNKTTPEILTEKIFNHLKLNPYGI